MVKTKWWIHVQSSVEEGRPVAPTPPATPQFSEGSGSFTSGMTSSVPFSVCGTLMEIVSPTAQDHILECALFFRRVNDDASLVLLSNDVTLKIKAMAEVIYLFLYIYLSIHFNQYLNLNMGMAPLFISGSEL